MIRLDDTYIKNSPIQSSKGNQFKWERDSVWYKADYPMGEDIIELITMVKAKTLSSDFREQLDVAEKLYGQKLYFTYDEGIINELLQKEHYYPEDIKIRIKEILLQQRRTYSYLFRKS